MTTEELQSEEDALLIAGASYEIWSPFDAFEGAQTLLELLLRSYE
jgi:hypothetical protein